MSTHASTKINQKEYLKKYLSGDSKEKKKKKKDKKHKLKEAATVRIYDDDEVQPGGQTIDEELLLTGDDAPQIVGEYVEERNGDGTGPSLWRSIGVKEEAADDDEVKVKVEEEKELWGRQASTAAMSRQIKKDQFSPPRRKIKEEPTRQKSPDADNSPPRRVKSERRRSKSAERSSRNQSSPRRNKPRERSRSLDHSPPRRLKQNSSADQSPPRKRAQSPPRRRQNRTPDQSPPRKHKQSPPRRRRSSNSDQSPPRRRDRSDADQSPVRKRRASPASTRIKREKRSASRTPPRKPQLDASPPPRRRSRWAKTGTASPSPPPTHKPKAQPTATTTNTKTTLDGKKAGLQDAQALKSETAERRRREDRQFAQMSSDYSGRDAEVQVRSTGRRGQRARDAAAEDPAEQRRKEEHEARKRELYDRWGKGLKQIEDHRTRCAEQQHESAKPLARYSNDADLERHLREQERADDPMLQYMRDKQKSRQRDAKLPELPTYQGSYPENRFGIRPGYRWDGVDRSNGYERKWFDVQNEKQARQEEAYKYSVEDM